jgi:hypothetical protein
VTARAYFNNAYEGVLSRQPLISVRAIPLPLSAARSGGRDPLERVDRAADVEHCHRRRVACFADGDRRVALLAKFKVLKGVFPGADPAGPLSSPLGPAFVASPSTKPDNSHFRGLTSSVTPFARSTSTSSAAVTGPPRAPQRSATSAVGTSPAPAPQAAPLRQTTTSVTPPTSRLSRPDQALSIPSPIGLGAANLRRIFRAASRGFREAAPGSHRRSARNHDRTAGMRRLGRRRQRHYLLALENVMKEGDHSRQRSASL